MRPHSAMTAAEGLRALQAGDFDAVLLDLMLPDEPGLDLLPKLRLHDPNLPVVVITAYSSIESAIEAMRRGAFHYVPKPFKNEEVLHVVRQAVEKRRLLEENLRLKNQLRSLENLIGTSRPMQEVLDLIHRAAPARSNILITGEPGTGKELVARTIHRLSHRRSGPFLSAHTAMASPELVDASLFGQAPNQAAPGTTANPGLFESASGGTLFLDEVGTLAPLTQAKLVRVIQEHVIEPGGAGEPVPVDVRVIAASRFDIRAKVQEGLFREDLYYRLGVIVIPLPPLRERREDIPMLAHYFLRRYARENARHVEAFTPRALNAMMQYTWPGNVRELENAVERCVVLSRTDVIDLPLLPEAVRTSDRWTGEQAELPSDGIDFKKVVMDYKKDLILKALHTSNGVQRRAARLLRLNPTTLNEMIRRLDITPEPPDEVP